MQDWGRFGYQDKGFACGGPIDEHAFLWANKLLGNNYNAAQIEISMGLFSGVFTAPTTMAMCGADTAATLNGQRLGNWRSVQVRAGDVLTCAYTHKGMRSYLAVAGGFTVPLQSGSVATVVREHMGGLHGAALAAQDVVPFAPGIMNAEVLVPWQFIPSFDAQIDLAVLLSYQSQEFSETALESFFGSYFSVSAESNRMGIRLQGPEIPGPKAALISEGIAGGAIQIPADGQPIILAKDRQTIGGYPKIGCVSTIDMSKLAQAQPGTQICFHQQSIEEASERLAQRNNFFGIK